MKTLKALLLLSFLALLWQGGSAQCPLWYHDILKGGGTVEFWASQDSSGTNPTWNWDFGDGNTGTGQTVTHTYATSGWYTYQVQFQNSNCTTTRLDSVYVNVCQWPVTLAYTNGDSVVSFSLNGAQPGWTYDWSFTNGNPATSTSATPTVTFPGAGYYPGTLVVNTPSGCTFNVDATASIYTDYHTGSCQPYVNTYPGYYGQVNFTAYSDSSSPMPSYSWDFGDGSTGTQQFETHTYATSGVYTYCVTFTGPTCSGTYCNTVTADICNAGIAIQHTIADSVVSLSVTGIPAGCTYLWSFPDGNITSSTDANPIVVFPGAGNYWAYVTVHTPSGCNLSTGVNIPITQDSCNVSMNLQGVNGATASFVAFADSSSGGNGTFNWSFGDGATDNGPYPSHTYATSGTYQYCLNYTGSLCSASLCDSVVIDICSFTPSIHVVNTVDSTVTFEVAGAQPGTTYSWAFPSGTPDISTDANPVVQFPDYGWYTASVTITTPAGCVKNINTSFQIVNNPCNAQIWNMNQAAGLVYFQSTLDTVIGTVNYTWDFGDGSTGSGQNPVHTYVNSGFYNYCLAYNGPGCSGTVCDTLYVDVCDLQQSITVSITDSSATLGLSGDSAGNWSYMWYLGTGQPTTSSAAHPVVQFAGPGVYPVYVYFTLPNGCSDTAWRDVVIPNQGFNQCDTSIQIVRNGATIYLSPLDTTSTLSSYSWDFGDGTTSTDKYATHTYAVSGVYYICMTVTSPNCTATNCIVESINASSGGNNGYITGDIRRNQIPACYATAYLIKDSLGYLSAVQSIKLTPDSNSYCGAYFAFYNLAPGTYYVKGALDSADAEYANFMPTYFDAELSWIDATPITITNNSNAPGVTVNLLPGNNPGGAGFVEGWVIQGAGLAIGGDNEHRSAGDPVPNVQINLLNAAGIPVAYTYTNAGGQFQFHNLAMGTYQVYAEALNKIPLSVYFTLDNNNPSVNNVYIEMGKDSAVGTAVEDLAAIQVDGVRPNPAQTIAQVSVSVKQNATVRMTLTDINGRLLMSKNVQLNSGSNQLSVDLQQEPAGVYHLRLTGEKDNRIIRLIKN